MRLKIAYLAAGLLLVAGCSNTATPAAPAESLTPESLADIKDLVTKFQLQKKRPPNSVEEFGSLEPAFPSGVGCVRSGQCVYVWGTGLQPSSQAVLAYGKDAAASGGHVLLQDGTVKSMTAAEFAAAPKAAKK